MKTSATVVHRPGEDGLFGSVSLCGINVADSRVLMMHEYDYTCVVCRGMSGEL